MILLAALLQSGAVVELDAELLAANSATAVLQKRCAVPIRAEVDRTADKPADADVRADLGAGDETKLVYRLVRLKCGDVVYSRAENWYRPDRLTASMNAALLTGDTPFGVVVRPLAPTRRTLSRAFAPEEGVILRHRAVVISGDGTPLAEVVESYTEALPLAVPASH
jgi:chorismate-pyruvate lyase